ncbi:TSUP family transporter [Rouxiella sp. S1S-2]|uniref:sulfite exporter TauE/SafE family protein n=1 Tax=Rouxiella sp. S1S-2 TaxID=2653856 RepID=UPI001265128D|nr:sulfite exporter TauE/SafE family protein [Rouxiella sp. S1S-2]KAB7895629.1 TSUP family transporter [Rouxiella sp. S1S-2]
MSEFTPAMLTMIAATFLLAGTIKGITGMGLPTVAMGLLGSLISPATAAGLLLLPSFITNLLQLRGTTGLTRLCVRLWPMMVMIVAGTMLGSHWLATGSNHHTTLALGMALVVYAVWTLFAKPLYVGARLEVWLSPLIGLTTGLLTGGTGVFVIPAVPWLQSLGLEKDSLVQALGLSFTVSTFALAAGLGWHGALHTEAFGTSALAVIPAMLGMIGGQKLRQKISPQAFKRGFLVCLLLLGVEMIWRSL